MRLGETRSTEACAASSSEQPPRRRLEAQCDLAGDQRAEIGIVLESRRHVGEELGCQIRFQIEISGRVRAMGVGCILRTKAREALGIRSSIAATGRGVVAVDV